MPVTEDRSGCAEDLGHVDRIKKFLAAGDLPVSQLEQEVVVALEGAPVLQR